MKTDIEVAALGLAHEHIQSQVRYLLRAGAKLRGCFDPDPGAVAAFVAKFPETPVYPSADAVLDDAAVDLVATAAIPCQRAVYGERALLAGKHVFTDKPGFVNRAQIKRVREACAWSGKKFLVYYPLRMNAVVAEALRRVRAGEIGDLVQFIGLGPHRCKAASRPAWFFRPEEAGSVLVDLGVHYADLQMLFADCGEIEVTSARMACTKYREHQGFFDYGEFTGRLGSGVSSHVRVDWLSPENGKSDPRILLLGTEGYLDVRMATEIAGKQGNGHLFAATCKGVEAVNSTQLPPPSFIMDLVHDLSTGGSKAIEQEWIFKAAEAVLLADELGTEPSGSHRVELPLIYPTGNDLSGQAVTGQAAIAGGDPGLVQPSIPVRTVGERCR